MLNVTQLRHAKAASSDFEEFTFSKKKFVHFLYFVTSFPFYCTVFVDEIVVIYPGWPSALAVLSCSPMKILSVAFQAKASTTIRLAFYSGILVLISLP